MFASKRASTSNGRGWLQIGVVSAIAAPAPIVRTLEIAGIVHLGWPPVLESILYGICIFAAATLLVWATEVAEQLVSAALALAILAIIAVLPEYAVDLYFAWTAADDPQQAHFALANMTGANRLLIGFAWPVVFFLFWVHGRRLVSNLHVGAQNSVGLVFLGIATVYSFSIPLRRDLSLIDTGFLFTLFIVYLLLSSRAPPHQAELVGPAQAIGRLPLRLRWLVVIAMFALAAGAVFAAAEPFAEGLVESGESIGVEEFLLVQWVAPLASEAPEFILAAMLALRGRAAAGMTLLISSKVNQWTLLVGSLPLAFSISGASIEPMHMDSRQAEEVFLTAGQSLFAVAVLTSLSFSGREAGLMFVLFAAQLVTPIPEVRIGFGALYIVLALYWLLTERSTLPVLFRTAVRTVTHPHEHHDEPPAGKPPDSS
jgi:cation:H+ antiporter